MSAASPSRGLGMIALLCLLLFIAIAVALLLPQAAQVGVITEGGPVETLSAVGYAVCIILMAVLWGVRGLFHRWYIALMMALFAARELDLDKRPFTEGLLKSRQYIGDTVPGGERLMAFVILIAIVATIVILVRRHAVGFLRGVLAGTPAAVATAVGIAYIAVFKSIDGIARKLAPYGIEVSEAASDAASVIEEVGELGIPLMFGLAIYLASPRREAT